MRSATRLAALAACLLLGSCANSPSVPMWSIDGDSWERATASGLRLSRSDGTEFTIPPSKVAPLVEVHRALVRRTGMGDVVLGLAEMESPNAFATVTGGRRVVAVTLGFLDIFWNDRDALATILGHELAHLNLGHQSVRREREEGANAASHVVGTVLGLAGVPFGGTIAGLGTSAILASYSRDEERAADRLGIAWAVDAGFDPCGQARAFRRLRSIDGPTLVPFLSTHPGYEERSDAAESLSIVKNGRSCGP